MTMVMVWILKRLTKFLNHSLLLKELAKVPDWVCPQCMVLSSKTMGSSMFIANSVKGTTIKVYLSRYIGKPVKTHSENNNNIPLSQGETILLVEDEDSILKLIKRILLRLGYTVLAANTPDEAFSFAQEYMDDIDLLITDVIMPTMNGRDLSENIKAFCPKIEILFMSGYTANVIAHRGSYRKEFIYCKTCIAKRNGVQDKRST